MVRTSLLTLLAATAIGLTAAQGTSSAADLGIPAPPPIYAVPAPAPYGWTGCYIGGNVGAAWAGIDITNDASSGTALGFAGGGQIGCDLRAGAWVFGVRNMFDGTILSTSTTFSVTPFTGTAGGRTHWFDTLTAREGYLMRPDLLLYVQGGAAWTNTDISFFNSGGTQVGKFSYNRTGWTVGIGAEWIFAPHWSAFVEYNFMGFGTQSAAFAGCGGTCGSAKVDIQDALLGVNYKF